jgi:CheY-like chemotaxis protein
MVRPCFIVVDPEHSGSISTRKLVIESAKLNVITAYSGTEAIETVKKYPAVDGVVCNSEVRDRPLAEVVDAIKAMNRRLPVIVVGPLNGSAVHQADYHIESFEPRRLLDLLQSLMPQKVSAITEHEDKLRDDETSS